ncbi:MAG TPA: transcription antitermination factor NusB [Rhizomicrobium sp.]|nr:transcription antitermination factor NusB [Rhizomicrobium sp.]
MSSAAGIPSRAAALSLLSGVLRQKKPLDALLPVLKNLAPRDAGFARALASGTLRHFGELEATLRHFVPKPLPPHKTGAAMEILLLGAAELLILKGAAHAAVDAANKLASADSKAVHFKPLINAVLRRLSTEGEAVRAKLDAPRLNTPDWLWQRWSAQYGEDVTLAIARAHQNEAPLTISLKNSAALAPPGANLFGLSQRVTEPGRVEDLAGFAEGGWWVQDAAATLPVAMLGNVRGKKVIDLCAAPGGKTMQLAAAGAEVIAVDNDATRLARLSENLARTGLTAALVESDARDFKDSAPFVLIDAPCTATGTIRRHPDLPWIKQPGDVTARAPLAYEILESGAQMVEPGGLLVFAVCSLEREEGEEQIEGFLSAHAEFARAPMTADELFGHGEWISPDGDLKTLPCHLNDQGGMDGFYAARLKRS